MIKYSKLPTVRADKSQMTQLFQNLIGNAIKFRREGVKAEIEISAKKEGNLFRFVVKDNGIGIDKKYLDRIFVIFQRLHTKEEFPGTGIGLAICKKIVERHGGEISVESAEGKGSDFIFTLQGKGRE
ncbi:MAG: ATP-binding protein [Geovibrio sp.]|nr:ATP-binding protein [Geovibrio sp.]